MIRPTNFLAAWVSLSAIVPAFGDELPAFASQKGVDSKACGPCSVFNSLLLGTPECRAVIGRINGKDFDNKVTTLIEQYGKKPSETYGKESLRYRPTGVTPNDLLHFANDLNREHGLPALRGHYLEREAEESLHEHLKRMHEMLRHSIDAGTPVIAYFRSFTAKHSEEKDKHVWTALSGHFVTVVEVQPEIGQNEKGFRFRFADPSSGKYEYGYLYFDEPRNFTAAKGRTWLKNRPFLLVTAPALQMQTQTTKTAWHLRTTITLNHAIYRPQADSK